MESLSHVDARVIPIGLARTSERPRHVVALRPRPERAPSGGGVNAMLLNLPWASWRRPSMQIGLLAAIGAAAGHSVGTAHLNLELAAVLGPATYEVVCDHRSIALGEWLFARAAFGDDAPPGQEFLARYGGPIEKLFEVRGQPLDLGALLAFREEGALALLERCVAGEAWDAIQLFGLSSTFQQNNACFAMARVLKRRHPGCVVVAGGANFDAGMGAEWMRSVEALDLVVSGEADETFPRLLDALDGGEDLSVLQNLIYRTTEPHGRAAVVVPQGVTTFRALDTLPTPHYDEYFARAERLGLLEAGPRRQVDLPFETSRGCWWGERRHCTFCGLNGQSMSFRAKSPGRVAAEMAEMAARYRSYSFTAVDNILDMKFHQTLLPELARLDCSYDIFFEVKSGLSHERLRDLHRAGVRRIQPGIESLSTHVLQLMDKGVSALANVNLLRWSAHLGLDVSWNIIWGFPGETQADYEQQLQWLRRLSHLQAPVGAGRIWLERFSPLYQARRAAQPPVRAEASLALVYPARIDLGEAAYFFEYDFPSNVDPRTWQETSRQVDAWRAAQRAAPAPALVHRYAPGFLQIDEGRLDHEAGIYTFGAPYSELYMALTEKPRPVAGLLDQARGVTPSELDLFLDEFSAAGLVLRDGAQALALSLPARRRDRGYPPAPASIGDAP